MNDESAVHTDECSVPRCRSSTFRDHVRDFFWSVAGRTIGSLIFLTIWTFLVAAGVVDRLVQMLARYLGI